MRGRDLHLVLRGAVVVLVIQVVAAALSYGSQVLLARWMGPLEFGIYAMAWSLVPPAAAVAAIGLPGAAVRFVPQYLARESPGQLHGLIRRSIALVFAVGIGSVAAGWLILLVARPWLADYHETPIRVALLSIPFLAVIVLVSDLSRGFGWAGLAFAPVRLVVPGLTILSVFIYLVYVGRPTALGVLALSAGACVVTAAVHLGCFRRRVPRTVRGSRPVYRTRLWLRVAIPLLLSDGVFLLLWSCDEVMLGAMTGPEHVAVFHACVKTAGLTLIIFQAVAAFATPRFAALWLDGNTLQLQRFARSVARLMFFPSLGLALGLIVAGPLLLGTFGDVFISGHVVLITLTLGYLAKAATGPVDAYLAVSGHQDAIVLVIAVSAVSNIVLNFLLIPRFGALGAAAASVVSLLLCQVWLYVLAKRRLGISSLFVARG